MRHKRAWKASITCAASLIVVIIRATAAAEAEIHLPSMESGNYAAYCSNEWTKLGVLNREMFNYCIQRELEGYQALSSEVRQYKSLPWLQSVVDAAITEWTKRDIQRDSMVAYTVHNDIDAYLDLAYSKQKGSLDEPKVNACIVEWTRTAPKWTMIRYCYKKATGTD